MAICAIVRIVGSISDFHHKGRMDDTWEYFWQYAESAVAVMMASITSFRTLFVKPSRNYNATTPHSPTGNWLHRIQARFQTLATAKPEKQEPTVASAPILKLPKIPRPILTGVRSLIRKNNRTGVGTRDFDTLDSEINAASEDYSSTLKPPSHSDTDNDIL
jgi:hypothetical protein